MAAAERKRCFIDREALKRALDSEVTLAAAAKRLGMDPRRMRYWLRFYSLQEFWLRRSTKLRRLAKERAAMERPHRGLYHHHMLRILAQARRRRYRVSFHDETIEGIGVEIHLVTLPRIARREYKALRYYHSYARRKERLQVFCMPDGGSVMIMPRPSRRKRLHISFPANRHIPGKPNWPEKEVLRRYATARKAWRANMIVAHSRKLMKRLGYI